MCIQAEAQASVFHLRAAFKPLSPDDVADLLDKMRENPAYGWRMADIQAVCDQNGVMCKPPKGGGSHYKVFQGTAPEILTIPFKRPIKPVYIRKLAAFIDAVKARK